MNFFLGLLAIGFGGCLIKFREAWADAVGEPTWAAKVGGMQIVMVIVGIVICFWGLATMTGTTDVLFGPILNFLPGRHNNAPMEAF